MSKPLNLSLAEVRRLAIQAQRFSEQTDFKGKSAVAELIEKLGYIQIDTIAVLQRAHHHTIWNRRPDYTTEMLNDLLAIDKRVFEYWGHAASYLPMSDYRYYIPRMKAFFNPQHRWIKHRLEQSRHILPDVLHRVRHEGPLCSNDFKPPPGAKRDSWWDWKPEKFALEILFWRGELMISERRNFRRYYDLTERVLPPGIDTTEPDDSELGRFLVRRALQAYGVAREKEIVVHIETADKKIVRTAVRELVSSGGIVPVTIEADSTEYFILPELLNTPTSPQGNHDGVAFLSPFDNLIIQRDRTRRLFGFDYTLECYLPAAKRQYGYFVLPILWQDRLVARLDAVADRKKQHLKIHKLMFEPQFDDFDEFLPDFVSTMRRFVRFNNCNSYSIARIMPRKSASKVRQMLKQLSD